MAADVEQVDGELIGREPVVAEGVSPQGGRGDKAPIRGDGAGLGHGRGQKRTDVGGGVGKLARQHTLLLLERGERLIALKTMDIGGGVVANARDQFQLVRELDQIVVGASGEGLHLGRGVLLRGEDDERCGGRRWIAAEGAHHLDAIHARHDQVLEDDGGVEGIGFRKRHGRVRAKAVLQAGNIQQHAPDGLADDALIVDQEHLDGVFGERNGRGRRSGDRHRCLKSVSRWGCSWRREGVDASRMAW